MLAFIILMAVAFFGAFWFVIVLLRPKAHEPVPLVPGARSSGDIPLAGTVRTTTASVAVRRTSENDSKPPSPVWPSQGIQPALLIVDDQPALRDMLVSLFEAEGCIVRSAENGQSALRQLERMEYDYVLLDGALPDMSGIDVLRELRRRGSKAKALLMSAFMEPAWQKESERLGVWDRLTKPFDVCELLERIGEDWASNRSKGGA